MAKKIEVITIHRNCNYGSVLQTYATQRIFKNLGYDCEVIDYIREQDTKQGLLKRLKKKKKILKNPIIPTKRACKKHIFPSYLKKEHIFNRFLNRFINLSPQKYFSADDLKANIPVADAYCTGSDQIWNSFWNEGVIRPYYLDFLPEDSIRFSYASSIGKKNISSDEIEEIAPMLKKYKYISVRENNSVELLDKMGINNVTQVLDPTLYLNPKIWNKMASDKYSNKDYIVTYNLHHDKRIDNFVKKLSKEKHLPVINISYNWHDVIRFGR